MDLGQLQPQRGIPGGARPALARVRRQSLAHRATARFEMTMHLVTTRLASAILCRTMSRTVGKWLWLVAVLGGLGALAFLRKSEPDRIRGDLESIATALAFEGNPQKPTWIATLQSCLAEHVADPVTLSVAPVGESSYSASSLLEGILAYASNLAALGVTLSDVGVFVEASGRRATANGNARLDILEPSAERRGEPRKFAVTLERRDHGWVIVHARVELPRIDQPEARP
jgi:hypothetical protein